MRENIKCTLSLVKFNQLSDLQLLENDSYDRNRNRKRENCCLALDGKLSIPDIY